MNTRYTAGLLVIAGLLALAACGEDVHSGPPATPKASSTRTPFTLPSHSPEPLSTLATDPDTAACFKAIRAQYEPGTAALTGAPTEPPACLSLTSDLVSEVASAVLEDQFSG
jgi:hypothetical protein